MEWQQKRNPSKNHHVNLTEFSCNISNKVRFACIFSCCVSHLARWFHFLCSWFESMMSLLQNIPLITAKVGTFPHFKCHSAKHHGRPHRKYCSLVSQSSKTLFHLVFFCSRLMTSYTFAQHFQIQKKTEKKTLNLVAKMKLEMFIWSLIIDSYTSNENLEFHSSRSVSRWLFGISSSLISNDWWSIVVARSNINCQINRWYILRQPVAAINSIFLF